MNLNRFFPLIVHVIVAATAVGWAAGLHHTSGSSIPMTYAVTGFAVGLGVTAFFRFLAALY